MKSVLCLLFFVSSLVVICLADPVPRKTIIDCDPVQGDKLLYKRYARAGGRIGVVKREELIIPEKGLPTEVIHCIKIIDNKPKSGSTAVIESGGLGFVYSIIQIRSKLGKGYDYDIEVYGS